MSKKNKFVNEAIEVYKEDADLDNALEVKVGYDLKGNYYFRLSGLEHEDPSGDWDLDIYKAGDSPYYMLLLGDDGEYKELVRLGILNSIETNKLANYRETLIGISWNEIPRFNEQEAEYKPVEVSSNFLNMVIQERDLKGMFYAKEKDSGVYVGVDNSNGDAWTEEFADKKTCVYWLDSSLEYYSEQDFGKVINDKGELVYPVAERVREKSLNLNNKLRFSARLENSSDYETVADLVLVDKITSGEHRLGVFVGDFEDEDNLYICPVDPENLDERMVVQLDDVLLPETYEQFKMHLQQGGTFIMKLDQNDVSIDLEEYYRDENTFKEFEDEKGNKEYWYEMTERPVSLGAQPKGFIEWDEARGRHGVVAYDRELTEHELNDYEMRKWNKDGKGEGFKNDAISKKNGKQKEYDGLEM